MPNQTMMFCRFSQEDERIKKWWCNLPDRQASNRLRKAVNFYLDFKKFRSLLELLNLLQISPEETIKMIKGRQFQSDSITALRGIIGNQEQENNQNLKHTYLDNEQNDKVKKLLDN